MSNDGSHKKLEASQMLYVSCTDGTGLSVTCWKLVCMPPRHEQVVEKLENFELVRLHDLFATD